MLANDFADTDVPEDERTYVLLWNLIQHFLRTAAGKLGKFCEGCACGGV